CGETGVRGRRLRRRCGRRNDQERAGEALGIEGDAVTQDHLQRRQAPFVRTARGAAPSRARGVLHRKFGEDRGGGAKRDVAGVRANNNTGNRMRYLPLTPEDRSEMLARIGVSSIDALFADIPAAKRLTSLPNLPLTKSEIEVERTLGRMAGKNI